MRRALAVLGLAAAWCLWKGRHELKRQFIGGQRCVHCNAAFASLPDAELGGTRHYDRARGYTRTPVWQDMDERARRAGL